MSLRIANTRTDRIAVDFTGVTPAGLASLSVGGVRETKVRYGNRDAELGELFQIDGRSGDASWRLVGDFSAVHSLGAKMTTGEIHADGPVGRHTGAGMRGGRIDVRGDAGDWLGAEMHGGVIRVRGSAGDFIGAAYRGNRRGMTGGTILIDGDAGDEVGARMRRGLVAIGGAVGDWLGMRMLAGTILVFGGCGASPGAAMRRGTIAVLGGEPPALLPTYRLACRAPLPMLRLVGQQLRRESFAVENLPRLAQPIELHHGDLLELSRGEILLSGSETIATLDRR